MTDAVLRICRSAPLLALFLLVSAAAPAWAQANDAHRLLLEKAEQGDIGAQYRLGFRYENGYGAPRDLSRALIWYRRAAEQGNPQAQHKLGLLYSEGEGIPQDLPAAYKWLSIAAKLWPDPVFAITLERKRDEIAKSLDAAELANAQREIEKTLTAFGNRRREASPDRPPARPDSEPKEKETATPGEAPKAGGRSYELLDESRFTRVLHVGPTRRLKRPSDAAAIARPGDLINIDAGQYEDCAVWRTGNIAIQGVGGYAHVRDRSCEGKAIWVFYASPVTVNHIRFSGARVPHDNGAGIRWEGSGTLIVKNSWFHNNQNGILTHNVLESRLYIEKSRFEQNGDCPTFCEHGVYAGRIWLFSVTGSEFIGHKHGHHIKSRAYFTNIVGNRIVDGPKGTASFAIDLPDSGTARITHNFIQKGPRAENTSAMISIGEEGRQKDGTMNPSRSILIESNVFQNDNSHRTIFVWNRSWHPVTLRSNRFAGEGIRYRGYGGPARRSGPPLSGR